MLTICYNYRYDKGIVFAKSDNKMTTNSNSTSSTAKKPVSVLCRKTWPKISEITKNGHIVFQVDARKSGYCGQKRFDCPSLAKAREKASEIEALYKNQGAEGAKLSLTGKHEINESFDFLLNKKVLFTKKLSLPEFISLCDCVDVLLDPIHFGGGNTFLEAMIVGTPMITMPGMHLKNNITSAAYKQMAISNAPIVKNPKE